MFGLDSMDFELSLFIHDLVSERDTFLLGMTFDGLIVEELMFSRLIEFLFTS